MKNYQPGAGGVNRVKNPLQLADNELVEARNAEFHPDAGVGGEAALTKRGGFTRLFADGLGGPVYGFTGLGLPALPAPPDPEDPDAWTPVDEINSFDDGSNMAITVVGAASSFAALADEDDASYVRCAAVATNATNGDQSLGVALELEMDAIAAPTSGWTHTLHLRVRRSAVTDVDITETDIWVSFDELVFGGGILNFAPFDAAIVTKADFDGEGTDWFDVEVEIPSNIVSQFESTGYDNIELRLDVFVVTNNVLGTTQAVTIDVAKAYITIEEP